MQEKHPPNTSDSFYPAQEMGVVEGVHMRSGIPENHEHESHVEEATEQLAGQVSELDQLEHARVEQKISDLQASVWALERDSHLYPPQELSDLVHYGIVRDIQILHASNRLSDEQTRRCLEVIAHVMPLNQHHGTWNTLRMLDKRHLKGPETRQILSMGAHSPRLYDQTRGAQMYYSEATEFLETAEHALSQEYGSFIYWRRADGTARSPECVRHFTESKEFLPSCVGFMKEKVEQEPNLKARDGDLRKFENLILGEMVGLPQEMVDDFMVSFSSRSMNGEPKRGIISFKKEYVGVDLDYWKEQLTTYVRNVEAIGVEQAVRLRKDLGILNFDYYSERQLRTMIEVLDGSPDIRELAETQEVTVVMTDSKASHNRAFDHIPDALRKSIEEDKDGEMTKDIVLFCEIDNLVDVYRNMVLMRQRCGIRASNLITLLHGSETEGMQYGAKDEERIFRETVAESRGLGRFFEKYMKPGKSSGTRNLILMSCNQGTVPDDSGRKNRMSRIRRWTKKITGDEVDTLRQILGKPMATVVAEASTPEQKLIVDAAPFTVSYDEVNGRMVGFKGRHPASTRMTRMSDNGIEVADIDEIPLNRSRAA